MTTSHDPEERAAAGRTGGQASKKHGLYAISDRGAAALDEVSAMEFRELRQALRDPAVREEIKLELTARLVIMSRVGFDLMGSVAERGGDPFGTPVVKVMGGYLNLLARLLGSFPQQDKADHARLVGEMSERVERFAAEQSQSAVSPTEAPEAPQAHDGSRLEEDLS